MPAANPRLKERNILEGNLFINLLIFALPIIFSNLIDVFYTAADMMIVGLSGKEGAVGSIGSCASMINMIVGLTSGFSLGANVVVGRAIGARDDKGVERAVHASVAIAIVCGLLSATAGILFCRRILIMLGDEGHILDMATAYCRIYFAGLPFGMVANFCNNIYRAKGNTKIGFVVTGISGALNVALNLLFVVVFDMNVVGVALATRLSSVFTATVLMWNLCHETDASRFSFRKMRFHAEETKEVFRVGVPSSLQSGITHFSLMLVQGAVNSVNNLVCPGGSYVLDGHAAGSSLESFVSNAYSAITSATVTFASQHYGAGRLRRIKKVMGNAYLISAMICVLGCALLLTLNSTLAGFYVTDPRAVEVVLLRNSVMAPFFCAIAFAGINAAVMRSIGYPTASMAVSILGLCLFRIAWVTFIFPHYQTLSNIYWSYPVSWTATCLAGIIMVNVLLNKKIKKAESIGG